MLKGILLFQGQLRKVSLEDWGGMGGVQNLLAFKIKIPWAPLSIPCYVR